MYIGPWQEFQLAQEGARPAAPSGAVLDNVRKMLEDAASCGDFDPEAVAKLGLLLAAGSKNQARGRPDSASSRASTNSRASSINSSFSKTSSRQHRSRYGSSPSSASSSRSQGTPGSHKESWTHKGVRMPPRDRIVNGVRIRAGGGTESGDRAAAESIALRVHSVAGSHGESPHSARSGPVGQPSSHTPRSSRSSVRSRASAPAATRSENIRTNENTRSRSRSKPRKEEHADNVEKTHDAKSVTSLLRAERRARFHTQRQDLDNLWGGKWKGKKKAEPLKPKVDESGVAAVKTMKAIYLDALECNDQTANASSPRHMKHQNVHSPLRSPLKTSSKEVVADMQLTKDHLGLVAKYFDDPDDALHVLTNTMPKPSPRHSIDHSSTSPTHIRNSGRISPLRIPPPSPLEREQNVSSQYGVANNPGDVSSRLGTPKTGDSRYQSVDALLDWAKDLDAGDDFLKDF